VHALQNWHGARVPQGRRPGKGSVNYPSVGWAPASSRFRRRRGASLRAGDDLYTASWDIDIAPSAAFIKVFLEHYFEFSDQSAVDVGLMNIRFRDQNGVDQTINFPDIDAFDHVSTQFNNTMTHVTYGLKVKAASGALVWTLGFWA